MVVNKPAAFKVKVKADLDRDEQLGVIELVRHVVDFKVLNNMC